MSSLMVSMKYSELFGINSISSTSEMLVAVSVARALGRRGIALSLEGVETDLSIMSSSIMTFFNHAVKEGLIITDYVPSKSMDNPTGGDWWVSEEVLDYWDVIAPVTKENHRIWTFSGMKKDLWSTVDKTSLLAKNLSKVVILIVGEHLARVWVDKIDETLELSFDSNESEEGGYYLHVLTAISQNSNIGKNLVVDINIQAYLLDYMKYLHGSIQQNHNKKYDVREKRAIAEHLGFKEGSVCVRWNRARITRNNKAGIIESRTLAIFKGFSEDSKGHPVVKYDTVSEPRTKEERVAELEDVPEAYRHLYNDITSKGVHVRSMTSDLYNTTFGNYIDDETEFFLPLDTDEQVNTLVTVADVESMSPMVKEWTMPGVDVIYWVLKQQGIEFDEALYIADNYPEGVEPLYEQYSYEVVSE